jgi:hypothetical protein
LFFEKVATFIPLFHAPSFRRKYRVHDTSIDRYAELDAEDVLILNAMFALSARFSAHSYFGDTPAKGRGSVFSAIAKALYEDALRLDKLEQCTLPLLQGCILLAFYQQTSRPTTQSWLLIGMCCRIAFDLGLNKLDEDILLSPHAASWESAEEWSQQEEQRRAWWLVWELDVFSSTIQRRPHAIDKSQIHVLLPVSDSHWFANSPVDSAAILPDPVDSWKSLSGCPNQDERAWFLVSSFLMATAHDLSQRDDTRVEKASFASTLDCFSLLLPPSFHLSSRSLTFTEGNIASCNWIISTIFMLHTYDRHPSCAERH